MGERKAIKTEKDILLESLTEDQIRTIQKDNPFIKERDALIQDLTRRGVKYPLITEISGLSTSTIHRIARGLNKSADYRIKRVIDLKKIRKAIEAFYRELINILQ